MGGIDGSLACREFVPAASVGVADGAASSLACLVRPAADAAVLVAVPKLRPVHSPGAMITLMSSLPAMESWPRTISTPRLILRPAEPSDVSEFTRLWIDPDVRRFLGGPVAEHQLSTYQQHFVGRPNLFTVVTRQQSTVLGSVSIDPKSRFDGRREVSYSFLPEHWGQGYAREAVTAVVSWAFDHVPSGDPSVIAVTQEANSRSCRLLEDIGMHLISSFVEWDACQVMYSMQRQDLRTDW